MLKMSLDNNNDMSRFVSELHENSVPGSLQSRLWKRIIHSFYLAAAAERVSSVDMLAAAALLFWRQVDISVVTQKSIPPLLSHVPFAPEKECAAHHLQIEATPRLYGVLLYCSQNKVFDSI